MLIAGRGSIILWEGASLWIMKAEHETAETKAHSHHAIQITFQLEGSFEISSKTACLSGPIVAIASDTSHALRASGAAALLFIDPESSVGRALSSQMFWQSPIVSLKGDLANSFLNDLRRCVDEGHSQEEMLKLGRKLVADLSTVTGPSFSDQRVRAMIDYARDNLENGITLPAAAKHINLSESRARHLFVASTGLPFKTYILWLRLERAVQLYASGSSITQAAHSAGFADSAHFSRTFRRTFGLAAAELRLDQ
jgi:AraC family transcriptional regulator